MASIFPATTPADLATAIINQIKDAMPYIVGILAFTVGLTFVFALFNWALSVNTENSYKKANDMILPGDYDDDGTNTGKNRSDL